MGFVVQVGNSQQLKAQIAHTKIVKKQQQQQQKLDERANFLIQTNNELS